MSKCRAFSAVCFPVRLNTGKEGPGKSSAFRKFLRKFERLFLFEILHSLLRNLSVKKVSAKTRLLRFQENSNTNIWGSYILEWWGQDDDKSESFIKKRVNSKIKEEALAWRKINSMHEEELPVGSGFLISWEFITLYCKRVNFQMKLLLAPKSYLKSSTITEQKCLLWFMIYIFYIYFIMYLYHYPYHRPHHQLWSPYPGNFLS